MIEYLSLPEAARAIRVPVATVKTWHADGVFPRPDAVIGSGTGSARRYGWLRKTITEWADDTLPLDRRRKW